MSALISARTASATRRRTGVVLAVILTMLDIVGMVTIGLLNAPVLVNVITTVLAVATLAAAVGAWQGKTWAMWVVAVTRGLSALSVIPIFLVPEAPKEPVVLAMSALALVTSIVAIMLLFVGRRRARA